MPRCVLPPRQAAGAADWGIELRALASTLLGGSGREPAQLGSDGQPTLSEVVELAEPMLPCLLPLRPVSVAHCSRLDTPWQTEQAFAFASALPSPLTTTVAIRTSGMRKFTKRVSSLYRDKACKTKNSELYSKKKTHMRGKG